MIRLKTWQVRIQYQRKRGGRKDRTMVRWKRRRNTAPTIIHGRTRPTCSIAVATAAAMAEAFGSHLIIFKNPEIIRSWGFLGVRLVPTQPRPNPPPGLTVVPPGGSKTSKRSIDPDLGPLRELLGAVLIVSWCLRELQSFKMTPPEPQHVIPRAFSMQI